MDGLARDWKGVVSQHEIKALLSEVFINGVQEEFRHVLNSEMARYGKLTEEQMYNAVKRHEVYLGRTKCLGGGGSTSTNLQKSTTPRASNNMYRGLWGGRKAGTIMTQGESACSRQQAETPTGC